MNWLFQRILDNDRVDAIIIHDADTLVDEQFLRIMAAHLTQGDMVIQGQHIISNPFQSWFAALTWAMFIIDNRIQNQGRSNLGWSAKHMGDSICFRSEVLRKIGWSEGLTEDFQFRQRLLLENIRITYEPEAKGFGEAPITWAQASIQRTRWLRGTADSSEELRSELLKETLKSRRGLVIDGLFQAYFPSYSTLSLVATVILAIQIGLVILWPKSISLFVIISWAVYVLILFLYPFWGLVLERAPLRAYLVILLGPVFIIWRTMLVLNARFAKKTITWVRTDHGSHPSV